ncbi:conserved hypothetical protein [Candidatus Defluviicoccus seviourii]|uniref:Hemerythrin-like domain-containing protein n=2 Tax=root TaxID=1 RepID=A0A564WDF0_9PROT|nr:conserved hypothetical protein [uncultured Defluviicoccus sp.]VUX46537.1 conserved hypothetical protein [Candidatus Defluviicoccus seviourii]HRW60478.1 bacteriohemerythrin [Defluviicoccus sp.]
MPMIQWTQEFTTGVEAIDNDHKVLISLINQLGEAIRSGEPQPTVRRVLDELVEYTSYHFNREEALMEACRYPDLEAHRRTHTTLKVQVADIRDRYARHPEAVHAREILALLKNWLSAHIMGRDKLYAPFMAAKREEVRAAADSFTTRTAGSAPAIAAQQHLAAVQP